MWSCTDNKTKFLTKSNNTKFLTNYKKTNVRFLILRYYIKQTTAE